MYVRCVYMLQACKLRHSRRNHRGSAPLGKKEEDDDDDVVMSVGEDQQGRKV